MDDQGGDDDARKRVAKALLAAALIGSTDTLLRLDRACDGIIARFPNNSSDTALALATVKALQSALRDQRQKEIKHGIAQGLIERDPRAATADPEGSGDRIS